MKSILLVLIFSVSALAQSSLWWEHTIVYQIYPRSFQDSDGDGVGDLKGIESRLNHFVNIGVETIWMSPIFESPMKDFGYDVSNFTNIDPLFGTLQDFDDLVAAAHGLGLKVVLDFIPNHSSNEHDWFVRSEQREDPYTDYYIWQDKKGDDINGDPIPPNNWNSLFRYSAWEWSDLRGQFYLHQFVPEQPDLNYRNPLVVQEMKDALGFWMARGVDGFRMDAVLYLVEDDQYRDEPLSGNTNDSTLYSYTDHIYTENLPETRAALTDIWNYIQTYSVNDGIERVTMLEAYLPMEDLAEYYNCGDYPFNFQLIEALGSPPKASEVKTAIDSFLAIVPPGRKANWVLGNHDQWRALDRYGGHGSQFLDYLVVDALHLLTMTLPGVAVTYYGEEIGMRNNFNITFEESVDPRGCNCGPDHYLDQPCSRDPSRTGMQWDDTANSGFTTGTPWLPTNYDYATVNVAVQDGQSHSHMDNYRFFASSNIRYLSPTFDTGDTKVVWNNRDIIAVGRYYQDDPQADAFVTVINFGSSVQDINILGEFNPFITEGYILADTYWQNAPIGPTVNLAFMVLEPMQALTLYLTNQG